MAASNEAKAGTDLDEQGLCLWQNKSWRRPRASSATLESPPCQAAFAFVLLAGADWSVTQDEKDVWRVALAAPASLRQDSGREDECPRQLSLALSITHASVSQGLSLPSPSQPSWLDLSDGHSRLEGQPGDEVFSFLSF